MSVPILLPYSFAVSAAAVTGGSISVSVIEAGVSALIGRHTAIAITVIITHK